MSRIRRIACGALLAAPLLLAAAALAQPPAEPEALVRLAAERGCLTCHEVASPAAGKPRLPPLGPSWQEIAARYRGDAGAEDALVRAIVRGTAGRHWKDHSGFDGMSPQGDWIEAGEARRLVRWILER